MVIHGVTKGANKLFIAIYGAGFIQRKNLVFLSNARMPSVLIINVGIANESDQVTKGHLVDALAVRGDEGRGTLR